MSGPDTKLLCPIGALKYVQSTLSGHSFTPVLFWDFANSSLVCIGLLQSSLRIGACSTANNRFSHVRVGKDFQPLQNIII